MPTLANIPAHRLRLLQGQTAGTLIVNELYRSLQGEGLHAGVPCVFVRLAACHLRCGYCDTPYAFGRGEPLAVDEVFGRALAFGDDLVEVTGGEPLLQPEVFPLMTRLADAGRTVLLETSGSLDISHVDRRVHVLLDLKTPGSDEVEANDWTNLDRLKRTDEVKFVVCDRADFDWVVARCREHDLTRRFQVLASPAFGRVEPTELAAWVLESGLPIRLQLQLHKLLWSPDARGV